jgi:PPOX class probable F420-dependent enzyme
MHEGGSPLDQQVLDRLVNEQVIWLTTVSLNGTPQPNPVWFYWNMEEILIYTPEESKKLKNIAQNPKVSLHFEGAEVTGGDVVVMTGVAYVEAYCPHPDAGFVRKYQEVAKKQWNCTMEDLFEKYNTLIRVQIKKIRRI